MLVRYEPDIGGLVDEGAVYAADEDPVRIARERKCPVRAHTAGIEIAAFDADIDIVRDWVIDARDQLPGDPAPAVVERVEARVAGAGAKIAAEAAIAAEIDHAVEHSRQSVDFLVEIEVGSDNRGKAGRAGIR